MQCHTDFKFKCPHMRECYVTFHVVVFSVFCKTYFFMSHKINCKLIHTMYVCRLHIYKTSKFFQYSTSFTLILPYLFDSLTSILTSKHKLSFPFISFKNIYKKKEFFMKQHEGNPQREWMDRSYVSQSFVTIGIVTSRPHRQSQIMAVPDRQQMAWMLLDSVTRQVFCFEPFSSMMQCANCSRVDENGNKYTSLKEKGLFE